MSLHRNWQNQKQTSSERGRYLLETGQWSDCEFIVGEESPQQRFKGHKLLLAMSSPVFEAMFFGRMAEKIDPIPIKDIKPDVFKAMLKYIYTDSVDLDSPELVCELCYCGKKYMLSLLIEKCTKFFSFNLSPNIALKTYEFAKFFEEFVLMQKCLNMICTRTHEVLNETTWETIEFGTLALVLEQDALEIDSEIELYSALEHWTKAECLKKLLDCDDVMTLRSIIGSALFKIRFLTLTPQEFAEGIGVCSLLTQDEGFRILMNLSYTKSEISMPEGFSTNASRRTKQSLTYICDTRKGNTTIVDLSSGDLHSWINLRVDKDICLLGIEIPTRIGTRMSQAVEMSSTYNHMADVQVFDQNRKQLVDIRFSKEVRMRTLVDIKFPRPIYIEKHKDYKVSVMFHNEGRYLISEKKAYKITCEPVSFEIRTYSNTEYIGQDNNRGCYRVLSPSIIYSYPPPINCRDDIEQQQA